MMMFKCFIKQVMIVGVYGFFSTAIHAGNLKPQTLSLKEASVAIRKDEIQLDTGRVQRTLKWTGHGFLTTQLLNLETGKIWENRAGTSFAADWQMPGQREPQNAELIDLQIRKSTDEGFASEMLEVEAEMHYPNEKLALRWRAWVWPGANGIRSQLLVKKLDGFQELKPVTFDGVDRSDFRVLQTSSGYVAGQEDSLKIMGREKWINAPEKLFDGDGETGWITRPTLNAPQAPSEIIVDLGKMMKVRGLALQQMNDYRMEGCLEEVEIHLSDKADSWGKASARIRLERMQQAQWVPVEEKKARYLRLVAPPTTKQNYNFWVTRLGEIYVYSDETPPPQDQSLRADYIPVAPNGTRIYAGLYSDTQNRNRWDTPLMREEKMSAPLSRPEIVDWASIAAIETDGEGIMLVKESNKTPNQKGLDTGVFRLTPDGLSNSGWGRLPYAGQITDEWAPCWASWCILYSGGDSERSFAIKTFDRTRFSYDIEKEYLIKCNSWGTHHRDAAEEKRVLVDLDAAKEIGVEDYQIDDGWQTGKSLREYTWKPNPEFYPSGWAPVRNKARDLGIQLSIWQAAHSIRLDDLKRNYDEAGFVGHKLDFVAFNEPARQDELIGKVREFIQYTDHTARANWDVTEIPPRFGYFWAREYGRLWLKNAKPQAPIQSIHMPSRVLKDSWELAHYVNMRMIELPIQNPKRVLKKYSDTYLHPVEYVIAQTFAGVPVFFESMYTYNQDQRQRMRALLDIYKQHRKAMWECVELPIGPRPDNRQITGFQLVSEDQKSGYLLLYRERLNATGKAVLPLHFMKNVKQIETENIISSTKETVDLIDGAFPIAIPEAPGFRLLRYRGQ